MAFDAGMVKALAYELNLLLAGAKIEKINQPEKDEILLSLHLERSEYVGAEEIYADISAAESEVYKPHISGQNQKLLISAGANNPRICLTDKAKENPQKPPMFCMQLRKYLTGAKIISVSQLEFERAMQIEIEAYDSFGFPEKMYLIMEIMGKYSNIIFCGEDKKIRNAIKIIELAPNQKRPLLPGLEYELPPKQNKLCPIETTPEEFISCYDSVSDLDNTTGYTPEMSAEKFICGKYMGISSLIAREIVCRAAGFAAATLEECDKYKLCKAFFEVFDALKEYRIAPYLIREMSKNDETGTITDTGSKNANEIEYTFVPIKQYGKTAESVKRATFSELIDNFFFERDRREHIKQRSSDILKMLTNAETRLRKKIALQREELIKCKDKDKYKLYGDVIKDSIYMLERGMKRAKLMNYYADEPVEIEVELDEKLTPTQNSQRYYKRYNKAKVAEIELTKQIDLAERELDYIYTVFDSLTKAESENDLTEIRFELYESGYASKMKNQLVNMQKKSQSKPLEFVTDGGFKVLCGKNNMQNDRLTTKTADRDDYWFHAKNTPGSHVILICDGAEPSDEDLTQAAQIAAYYSKAAGEQNSENSGAAMNVAVDYTPVGQVKKPNGSKPGFVIYRTNRTAYVTPDAALVERLKINK